MLNGLPVSWGVKHSSDPNFKKVINYLNTKFKTAIVGEKCDHFYGVNRLGNASYSRSALDFEVILSLKDFFLVKNTFDVINFSPKVGDIVDVFYNNEWIPKLFVSDLGETGASDLYGRYLVNSGHYTSIAESTSFERYDNIRKHIEVNKFFIDDREVKISDMSIEDWIKIWENSKGII